MTTSRESQSAAVTIARAIARKLCDSWTVETHEDWPSCDLVRSDGLKVIVRAGGFQNEGRVSFNACWPRYTDGRSYDGNTRDVTTKITVADSKPAAVMARDLERRLIASFEVHYREARARVDAHEADEHAARSAARSLAARFGGSTNAEERGRSARDVKVYDVAESVRGVVVHSYGDEGPSVSFEVSHVSPDVAAQIFALLGKGAAREVAA